MGVDVGESWVLMLWNHGCRGCDVIFEDAEGSWLLIRRSNGCCGVMAVDAAEPWLLMPRGHGW